MTPPDALTRAVDAARQWARSDLEPRHKATVESLIGARSSELVALFDGRISFGTAGLRAEVGPGPNRMNAVVVAQTTRSVVRWLTAQPSSRSTPPRVLIGFDARHDSASFAAWAAAAATTAGAEVTLADRATPTPVVAHALLDEGADAAIVITASHNPAPDNGYKLYLADGLQLVPPADGEIAERIVAEAMGWAETAGAVVEAHVDVSADAGSAERWTVAHRAGAVRALATDERVVTVAYSPMHGVAGAAMGQALTASGFAPPVVVAAQEHPDPRFPTVDFPNPEEPGALDLLIAEARAADADVAMAHDPDGDRLALAVPDRHGTWTALSGNQLGALLADHLLRHSSGRDRVVARSVVSSRLLDAMAAAHQVQCRVTLTGFKWVARPMLDADFRWLFGFEEAIGYCVSTHVRDKDGITAGLVAAEMVADARSRSETLWDRLDRLAVAHGVHATRPVTVRLDDMALAETVIARLETSPPDRLVTSSVAQAGAIGFGSLPATPGVHLLADDATQVIVRPSGTEPKLKAYVEVIESVLGPSDLERARLDAGDRLDRVVGQIQSLLAV